MAQHDTHLETPDDETAAHANSGDEPAAPEARDSEHAHRVAPGDRVAREDEPGGREARGDESGGRVAPGGEPGGSEEREDEPAAPEARDSEHAHRVAPGGCQAREDEPGGREAPGGGTADREDLDREVEELGVAVMATSRLFVAISARALASTAESLTLPQLRALVVLDTCGPVKLVALAATLGVNPSTALRMVGRLEGLGLVDRRTNPDNRREVVLSLTSEGHDLVTRVLAHRRAEIRKLVQRLPAEERAALIPALRALTTTAGEMAVEAYDSARAVRGIVDDPLDAAVSPTDT